VETFLRVARRSSESSRSDVYTFSHRRRQISFESSPAECYFAQRVLLGGDVEGGNESESLRLTLYTSEKNPEPIFSRIKSSTEYNADTAVLSALHDGPVTKRSEHRLLVPLMVDVIPF
jgi:hypothetical protein